MEDMKVTIECIPKPIKQHDDVEDDMEEVEVESPKAPEEPKPAPPGWWFVLMLKQQQ